MVMIKCSALLLVTLAIFAVAKAKEEKVDREGKFFRSSWTTLDECLCQCSNKTFVHEGRTHGQCLSTDESLQTWCYVDRLTGLDGQRGQCRDERVSARFGGEAFTYRACKAPSIYSDKCQSVLESQHRLGPIVVGRYSVDSVPNAPKSNYYAHNTVPSAHNTVPSAHNTVPYAPNTVPYAHNTVPYAYNTLPQAYRTSPYAYNTVPYAYSAVPFAYNSARFGHRNYPFVHNTAPYPYPNGYPTEQIVIQDEEDGITDLFSS